MATQLFSASVVGAALLAAFHAPDPPAHHPGSPAPGGEVLFNQCWLESAWSALGGSGPTLADDRAGCHDRDDDGLRAPSAPAASFDEPESVLAHVLANAPADPVVYPTEGYYYYMFHLGPTLVSGNIRFSDIWDEGKIGVGYFDAHDRRRTVAAEFGVGDRDDGVTVDLVGDGRVRVGIAGGPSRVFSVVRSRDLPAYAGELWESEAFVASVIDESGVPLALMYHEPSASFYYLLHEGLPSTDHVVPLDAKRMRGRLLVAQRSRFVFYEPPARDRRVLVGVRRQSVRANDWFDGPFDQVPPRLDLKERLEASYPYVKLRGGIDAHGRFRRLDAQRVAISPYRIYDDLPALRAELASITRDHESAREATLEMVREWKRDFMPSAANRSPRSDASLPYRQGWPANHWGVASGLWPEDHERPDSRTWPANHAVSASHK